MAKHARLRQGLAGRGGCIVEIGHQATFANAAEFFNSLLDEHSPLVPNLRRNNCFWPLDH